MSHDLAAELERWGEDYREALHKLTELHLNPFCLLEDIMSGIDDLKALGPRLDAIQAKASTANADLTAQIAQLQGDAMARESELEAVVGDTTSKVSAIETALGITQPAAAEPEAPAEPATEQPVEGQ